MSKKPLPKLTDTQRDLCQQCYGEVETMLKKARELAQKKRRVVDDDRLCTTLHSETMRCAGGYDGRCEVEFRSRLREWLGLRLWSVVLNAKPSNNSREYEEPWDDELKESRAKWDDTVVAGDYLRWTGLTREEEKGAVEVLCGDSPKRVFGHHGMRVWNRIQDQVRVKIECEGA